MLMDAYYSPGVPATDAQRVFQEGQEFFNTTWGQMGEVAYKKFNPNPNPSYFHWDLEYACDVNLFWDLLPQQLALPQNQSQTTVITYWFGMPSEPGGAQQVHTDAYDILELNDVDKDNPAYILYPELQKIRVSDGVLSPVNGAVTFGPGLVSGIGEGAVWQRTTGAVSGSIPIQTLVDRIGPTHELFHLVARSVHGNDYVYGPATGEYPDSGWYRLYSPSLTADAAPPTQIKSWNGEYIPNDDVLDDLPFATAADAEQWMVVSSVQSAGGGAVQSQCARMRLDPKVYLISTVY